jgi:hypothetical protein
MKRGMWFIFQDLSGSFAELETIGVVKFINSSIPRFLIPKSSTFAQLKIEKLN